MSSGTHSRRVRDTKAKGARNERRSRRLLEAAGFCVVRAGGSLGPFDLVALNASCVLLVQVKSNRWPSEAELETMRSFPAPHGSLKVIHRWDDRKHLPQVRAI